MWSSKVYSMKQPHLFNCGDQSTQDLKKNFHDRMKSNNFVIREVPIQKLFNVEHCTNNSSGDLSDCIESNNFSSTGMNALDYNMPELVVFIQEDQQQYVKDICIDREVLPEKCEMKRRSELNLMETISNNSFGSECSSQHISFKEAMKVHGFRNLMKSEMELDLGNRISIDQLLTRKTASETLREAFNRERNFSRSFENWQRTSFLRTSGSKVEFPHSRDCLQVTDTRQVDYPQEETSNSASDSQSSQASCICHAKTSSMASHQSNDSISSAHSFSFPVLPVEWSGSPVRMMEADQSQSRKQRWRKMWFPCCDCDD